MGLPITTSEDVNTTKHTLRWSYRKWHHSAGTPKWFDTSRLNREEVMLEIGIVEPDRHTIKSDNPRAWQKAHYNVNTLIVAFVV